MCTDIEFTQFTLSRQISYLYEYGTHIISIRYYGYKVNLYLLHQFYVEVFYNHKKDIIEKIELLDYNHSRIKFYADQIRLPTL